MSPEQAEASGLVAEPSLGAGGDGPERGEGEGFGRYLMTMLVDQRRWEEAELLALRVRAQGGPEGSAVERRRWSGPRRRRSSGRDLQYLGIYKSVPAL
jgi:hypothetical protein